MVLIGLLYRLFWNNLASRKFPNRLIYINKKDFERIEAVHFEYPIGEVNLNGSSLIYLSKLVNLSKKAYNYITLNIQYIFF